MTVDGVTTNYTYNNLDQLLTAGPRAFAYDARGNLTRATEGGDVTDFSWDALDRLSDVALPDGTLLAYTYHMPNVIEPGDCRITVGLTRQPQRSRGWIAVVSLVRRHHEVTSMTTIFTVQGPHEVPTYHGKAGRTITQEGIQGFWGSHPSHGDERGCYVFAIRAGGGFTPGYVGKATKAFRQEVFAPHKLAKYQQFLADYAKGTPVLFFVIAPAKKGKVNSKHIAALEDFLIQKGVAANPQLLNVEGTQQEEWAIQGILRSAQGKPTMAARELKKAMKSS